MNLFTRLKIGQEKYPALTGIRAIGASVVFFDHFPFVPAARIEINVLAFFFMLSGFLIVNLYYNRMVLSAANLRTYFINRYARIYPVYFLLLTIAIFLGHNFSLKLLLKNYTLTQALFWNSKDFVIEPCWSLTVEECFYFLAPLFILLIRKVNFVSSLLFAVMLLCIALLISRLPISFLHTPKFVLSTTFFGHFFEFFIGVYLAIFMLKKEKKGSIKIRGINWTVAGSAGVLSLIILMMFVYRHAPLNFAAIILINNFLIPLPVAFLFYGLISEESGLSRVLAGKYMGLIGKSSYSFYVLHVIVIIYLGIPILLPFVNGNRILCIIITYLLTHLLAILLFAFYEEPLNYFIRKKLVKKPNKE